MGNPGTHGPGRHTDSYAESLSKPGDGRSDHLGSHVRGAVVGDRTARTGMGTGGAVQGALREDFHATPSAIGISRADGRFINVNENIVRLTGYSREELIGHTTLELNLWADPSERARIMQEIVGQGSLHNREGRLRTKSGDIRNLIVSVEQIQISLKPVSSTLRMTSPHTKEAEEALRENEQRMCAILDGALDAVVGMDKQGVITAWNPRAEAIFGWSRDEAIDKAC